jgi:hypothetical protein
MNSQTKYIKGDITQNFVTEITHNPPQLLATSFICNPRTRHALFKITVMVQNRFTVTFALSCLVPLEGTHGCPLIQKKPDILFSILRIITLDESVSRWNTQYLVKKERKKERKKKKEVLNITNPVIPEASSHVRNFWLQANGFGDINRAFVFSDQSIGMYVSPFGLLSFSM